MGNEDSNYKRVEDQEWRKSVESRLVSLTSAQKQTDDDLDKINGRLDEMDELLSGDPLKRDDSGLKGDVSELSRAVNALRAIMAPDQLGHGGIKNRLETVETELGLRVKSWDGRRKVLIAVISALAMIATAIVTNLDRIGPSLKKLWKQDVATVSKPQRTRGGKTNKRRPRPVPEANDGPQEAMPEGRSGDDSNPE